MRPKIGSTLHFCASFHFGKCGFLEMNVTHRVPVGGISFQ